MTTTTYTREDSCQIASTIKRQIGAMTLMSLGASDFVAVDGGLRFQARILPFNEKGKRLSRPRKMFVEVKLNFLDLYDLQVSWLNKFALVEHYSASNIDAYFLSDRLFALDYDGPEVLNPRV